MLEDNVLFDFFLLNFSISMFSLSLCLPTSSVYSSIKQYHYESIELESFYGIYFLLFSYYDRFFGFFFSKMSEKLQSMSSWGACGEASTLVSVDASIGSLRYTKPVSNCVHFNQ